MYMQPQRKPIAIEFALREEYMPRCCITAFAGAALGSLTGGVLLLAPRVEADSESKPKDLIRYILHPFANQQR